jgi:hypothetical protein
MRPVRTTLSFALGLLLVAGLPASVPAQDSTSTPSVTGDQAISSVPAAPVTTSGDGWPCEQRLQPELSIGAVWSGPDPTAAADSWRDDNAVQTLVSQIAPRRLPQSEAIADIHRFAAGYGKDKADVLTKVFAGLFETMNEERSQIIRGIRHFNDRQKKLADRIQNGTKALDGLDPNATDQAVVDQREALQNAVTWDSRIFDDRERLLPIVCGQPVTIEQRLFALSRAIGGEIGVKN